MVYELISPEGSVASTGQFTHADARAPRGGLIDQLATLIAERECLGLDNRGRAKWLPIDAPERAAAVAVYGDEVVSDSWAYAADDLHTAFIARQDRPVMDRWSVRFQANASSHIPTRSTERNH
ncbi:hypothetical protein BKG82_26725 [Mycobacteroides chelonae]|uniref:Uncharacterized protein n=1 Tax=Mycobacteroides chelonae TaxID=1774 RepID=A0A1S1LIT7_MYCCH|nr:hypothetical protein BKG82_26725 [Mycobacteroides chelonae]